METINLIFKLIVGAILLYCVGILIYIGIFEDIDKK